MNPDAIIILSAGTVPLTEAPTDRVEEYRSTTYDEGDAFGILGGRARMEAGAILGKKYPNALIVSTGKRGTNQPSHAAIIRHELEGFGISRSRVLLEEESVNTLTQIQQTLNMAAKHNWKNILYVSNEYQIERMKAFIKELLTLPENLVIEYQAAEPIIIEDRPEFAGEYEQIKAQESYVIRVASEARGVAAIKSGDYTLAPLAEKLERKV